MGWFQILLLIAGGLLACSTLIINKKPEARELLAKLVPAQAFIGLGLLVIGVIDLLRALPHIGMLIKAVPVLAMGALGADIGGALLGIIFGMPLIAKATGKDGGALVQKLAPFQVILGLVCLGSAAILLLFTLGILKFI